MNCPESWLQTMTRHHIATTVTSQGYPEMCILKSGQYSPKWGRDLPPAAAAQRGRVASQAAMCFIGLLTAEDIKRSEIVCSTLGMALNGPTV